jgi:hypothetical protein
MPYLPSNFLIQRKNSEDGEVKNLKITNSIPLVISVQYILIVSNNETIS